MRQQVLQDFYCSVEKIFERIAVLVDKNLPVGENWHVELLSQMAKPWKDIRDKVIKEELMNILKEFMRFRHLFRHIYGFELRWKRFKHLLVELEGTYERLKPEIEIFIKRLWPENVSVLKENAPTLYNKASPIRAFGCGGSLNREIMAKELCLKKKSWKN